MSDDDPNLERVKPMDTIAVPRIPIAFVVVGLLFPTWITWVYFDWLKASPTWMQQSAFSIGKLMQLALPCIAYLSWQRHVRGFRSHTVTPAEPRSSRLRDGVLVGLVSGVVIAATVFAVYFLWIQKSEMLEMISGAGQAKLKGLGIDSTAKFVALALFYTVLHSGFEEVYWRGFVFRGLQAHYATPVAIAVSSIGFMAHHVLVLAGYFGWSSVFPYLFASAVAIGGAIWAAMARYFDGLLPSWISHAFVDASLFAVAYGVTMMGVAAS